MKHSFKCIKVKKNNFLSIYSIATNQVLSSIPRLCEAVTPADLSRPGNSKSNHLRGNCLQQIQMSLKLVIAKHRQALIKARFVMHQQWLLN